MDAITFRPLAEADLSDVLVIEHLSFPSPWSRASFVHELRSPHSRLTAAEKQGRVVGYLCCWQVADEVHILDIAVHPEQRRQGIGEQLLRRALTEGREQGAQSANLEVRRSNKSAIALYETFGFRTVAIRRRYYDNGEDALLMVCSFAESKEEQ